MRTMRLVLPPLTDMKGKLQMQKRSDTSKAYQYGPYPTTVSILFIVLLTALYLLFLLLISCDHTTPTTDARVFMVDRTCPLNLFSVYRQKSHGTKQQTTEQIHICINIYVHTLL